MKLLITGASGFVGQNLLNYLSNYEVSILQREDLHNPQIGDANAVIHLAGKAHDLRNTTTAEDYYSINYELTKKLYDAFLASNARTFIFMSSVKAAADSVPEELSEEDVPLPLTHYGKSKLLAEQYICSQSLPKGKFYYILRPCMIHGPGNKGNLNLLYKFAKKKMPYPLAAFDNKRSFLSISNLNMVIERLITNAIPNGIYNVSDDEPLSTNDVINLIGTALGFKAVLFKLNPATIRFIARMGDIVHFPLNTERLNKLTESYIVSNKKIKSALNVTRFPISSKEGLLTTIKSFQKK